MRRVSGQTFRVSHPSLPLATAAVPDDEGLPARGDGAEQCGRQPCRVDAQFGNGRPFTVASANQGADVVQHA